MKYKPGDSVIVPGRFQGKVLCICQYQGDYTYRVGYYDNNYCSAEFYEFELEESSNLGFKR